MIEFRVLGITGLRREDGTFDHSFLTGPKRLALLTYLILAKPRSFHRRDKLLAFFWPETGEKSARNSLSNMLYHIRRSLGDEILINRGIEEISINFDKVWCDVQAFEQALDNGEPMDALNHYHDDLLQGFHVTDISNAFESWLGGERERLRSKAAEAAWQLAREAEEIGNLSAAQSWAKKAVAYTDLSEEAHIRLVKLLERSGMRTEALKSYEEFARKLKSEWEMEPSANFRQLVKKIRVKGYSDTKQQEWENSSKPERSIAVLPFETLGSQNPSAFASGVHRDILNRLSNISDLQVISRTSVRKYANTNKSVREIWQELPATWFLEGDVQETGSRVQVNVRLINAENDRQVWARDYRKSLSAENLFKIQSEITKEIAESLKAELTPEEKRRVERRPTDSLDAYRLYAQGRSWLDMRTEEGMRKALHYFNRAIEKDPGYALASVGLADTLSLLHDYGFEEAESVLPEAEKAIQKALELDNALAEAHASYGLLHSNRYMGFEALQELEQAINLRPGYAEAHNWLSWVCMLLGDANQALKSAQHAVELDPLSPEAVSNLSLSYLINGESEKALLQAERVCQLQPTWTTGPFYKGLAYYHLGKIEKARSVLKNLTVPWAGIGPQASLALTEILAGNRAKAEEYLVTFEQENEHFASGLLWAALGDKGKAFAAFDQIERWEAWPCLAIYHLYPESFYNLKQDNRFKNLLIKVNESWGMFREENRETKEGGARKELSIAVLPFVSLGTSEEEIFVKGIHDDLLTRLSGISGIEVTSRTSVIRYKDTDASLQEISRELGVNWIVEGSVQQVSNNVHVRVRLVNTLTDRQLWAKDFQKELTLDSIFKIQSEITREIAAALETQLTPSEKRRIERQPTESLDAYRLYTQGWSWVEQRTEKGMRRALDYFNQAIDRDPGFSLALVGRALTLLGLHGYGFEVTDEILDEAEDLINRALEQDQSLAETHAALGLLHSCRYKGPEAIEELTKAVSLRPGYANAHNKLSWVNQLLGNRREALKCAKKAVDLDPFSPEAVVNLSFSYLINGDTRKALQEADNVCKLQPDWTTGPFYKALALYHSGRFKEAGAILEDLQVDWAGEGPRATRALIHLKEGRRESASELLDIIKQSGDLFAQGLILQAMGHTTEALNQFEKIVTWGAWPTHSMHHLFPDVLGTLKYNARFIRIYESMQNSWNHPEPKERRSAYDKEKPSIAVLPFIALGGDSKDIFVEGLHDDILTRLSAVGGLGVTSRTSVISYRDASKSIPQIAEELDVQWIVEGSVQMHANRVQVRIRLVNTRTEKQYWSKDFEHRLTADNLFKIQGIITKEIARSLKLQLTPREKRRAVSSPTDNLDAYRLFIRGRNKLEQRSEESIREAYKIFNQAIEQDPDYALAWIGIADCLSLLHFYDFDCTGLSYNSFDACQRALEIDPDLGEAHTSLGIHYSIHNNGSAALLELQKAVELCPSYAEAWIWLGWVQFCLGRPVKALDASKVSLDLNPMSPAVRTYHAEICLANEEMTMALHVVEKAIDLQPDYGLAHFIRGLILYHMGELPAAISEYEKVFDLVPVHGSPTHDEVLAASSIAYLESGDREMAQKSASAINADQAPFSKGLVLAAFGKEDAAIEYFRRVEKWESFSTDHIRYFFPNVLGELRKKVTFTELIERVNASWNMSGD